MTRNPAAMTSQFTRTSSILGSSDAATERIRSSSQPHAMTPRRPPASARMADSNRTMRTTRARVAPSAKRMASSRPRLAIRETESPAMFTDAISSTKPTAPSSVRSGVRALDPMLSRRSEADAPTSASVAGYSRCNCVATTRNSVRAESSDAPGRSLAI